MSIILYHAGVHMVTCCTTEINQKVSKHGLLNKASALVLNFTTSFLYHTAHMASAAVVSTKLAHLSRSTAAY